MAIEHSAVPPSTAPPAGSQPLRALAERVQSASLDVRPFLAGTLNDTLRELGRSPSRSSADEILALLASDLDVSDENGQPCRVAASEALLAMGHPFALEIAPRDIEALRAWHRRSAPPASLRVLTTLFVGSLFQFLLLSGVEPGKINPLDALLEPVVPWWRTSLVALPLAALAAPLFCLGWRRLRPESRGPKWLVQAVAAANLGVAALWSGVVVLFSGSSYLFAVGLAFDESPLQALVINGASALLCARWLKMRQ